MKTRKLGSLDVSIVGLGCNNFGRRCDQVQTTDVVNAALEVGVSFFDTADVYGEGLSETFLGKALGRKRDEVLIASKFGHPMGTDPADKGASPTWISKAIDATLKRLGTDRVDLYQIHVPDPSVPIEETLDALTRLVKDGKVIHIGCSNFSGEQIDEAIRTSDEAGLERFVSAQNHYNLLTRGAERDVFPACERAKMGFLPYFPLASGLLTGKYKRSEPAPEGTRLSGIPADRASRFLNDKNFDAVEALETLAKSKDHTLLELAISWLATKDVVSSVIAGATRPEQVKANAQAADWEIDEATLSEIDAITESFLEFT